MVTDPYIIGITGGSASGKTFFQNHLLQQFSENEVCLISQDNYYLPLEQQPLDERGVVNFDTPSSIDAQALAEDILKIKKGQAFSRYEYTFNNPDNHPRLLHFKPAPVVIVEGLFIMYFKEVRDLFNLKLFISTKEHIKLKRRIERDKMERGYDLDDVLYRFEKHVMPAYDKYVAPLQHEADIVIPNNNGFNNALNVIVGFLKSHLVK